MHSFTIPEPQHPRKWLNRFEAVAHATTALAFALTIVLVTTGHATELNAVADVLFGTAGWAATGVIAIGVIAASFSFYRLYVDSYRRLMLAAGGFLALAGIVDLSVNLWILYEAGLPESVRWGVYAPAAGLVLFAGFIGTFRHSYIPLAVETARDNKRELRAVSFALLVAASLVALPFMGGISPNPDHDGTAAAGHDWDYQEESNSLEASNPFGVYLDSDGNYWVLDNGNDQVYKYNSSWGYTGTSHDVSTEDGGGQAIYQRDNGNWLMVGAVNDNVYEYNSTWDLQTTHDIGVETSEPSGLDKGPDGNWWIVDKANNNAVEYNSTWAHIQTIDLSGTDSERPSGLRYGASGNWWVTDNSNTDSEDKVHKFESDWTDTGTGYHVGTEDNAPQDLVQHPDGHWWVVGSELGNSYKYGGHAGNPISGKVTDGDGDPVTNATVYVAGYDAANPPTIDGTQFDKIASDPLPDGWSQQTNQEWADRGQIDVDGTDLDGTRVLMHTRDQWNLGGHVDIGGRHFIAQADLSPPQATVDTDADIVLSCWDTQPSSRDALFEDNVGSSLGGAVVDSCDGIVVEKMDPTGDIEQRSAFTPRTSIVTGIKTFDTTSTTYEVVFPELGQGIYKVYPEETKENAVYYAVSSGGDVNVLQADIENWASNRSEAISKYNEEMEAEYDAGNLEFVSTTTNSTGHYTLDVPNQATEAELRVVKDGGANAADPGNLTRTDLRDEIDTTVRSNFDAESGVSFDDVDDETFKSVCERMDPIADDVGVPFYGQGSTGIPNQNADIEGQYLIPNDLDPKIHQCAAISFVNSLLNDVGDFLTPGLADDLNDLSKAELESLLSQAQALIETNGELCEEFATQVGASSCEDALEDPSDLTRDELETRVSDGYDTVDDSSDNMNGGGGGGIVGGGGVDVGDGDTSVGDETFSTDWNVGGVSDWGDAELMIRLTWSNGTTTVLNESSEYVSVDESVVGADTVRLSEYPIGNEDPAAVQARLDIVTQSSTGSGDTGSVKNPTWDGDIPSLNSLKVSKWEPGEQDSFTVGVDEEDNSRFGSLQRVEVTAPDGTTSTFNTVENGEIMAQTKNAGDHRVGVVFTANDDNNTEFTEVVQVRAGSTSKGRPPSIRGQSGAIGRYAVVGHGLDAGEIEVERGGSEVTMTGVIPQDADVPKTLTADTTDVSVATDATTTVRLRRGSTRQTIRDRINVVLYADEIDDDALVWRNGDALTREGTQWGEVTVKNGTTVDTISDETASVAIRVNGDPSVVDRVRHWVSANVNFPSLPVGMAAFDVSPLLAALVAFRRREPPEPPKLDVREHRQPNPQEV